MIVMSRLGVAITSSDPSGVSYSATRPKPAAAYRPANQKIRRHRISGNGCHEVYRHPKQHCADVASRRQELSVQADEGPIVRYALLRDELRRLRAERGLTQEQVAQSLDWSPYKIQRIERGTIPVTKAELYSLLNTLDYYRSVSTLERQRLIELHHDQFKQQSERARLTLKRLARALRALVSVRIVTIFMNHRHHSEPPDEDSSPMATNRPLAGAVA